MGAAKSDLVALRDLKVAFDGVQVLHGIDLNVAKGEGLSASSASRDAASP